MKPFLGYGGGLDIFGRNSIVEISIFRRLEISKAFSARHNHCKGAGRIFPARRHLVRQRLFRFCRDNCPNMFRMESDP